MGKRTFVLPLYKDPCPELRVERDVGQWVRDSKHTMLAKWIDGTRGARRSFPRRVLIDPFCGPGRVQVRGEQFTRDGGCVIATHQAVASRVPFTQVLVGDLDPERLGPCVSRLIAFDAPVQGFCGTAAATAPLMRAAVPSSALCLVYLDPYDLSNLTFSIIEEYAKLRHVDFLVHFSVSDVRRNVDFGLDVQRERFDGPAPGWHEKLAGLPLSKASLAVEYFSYWRTLVERLGFTFDKQMPIVRGENNAPLYRLCSFSRNPLSNKVFGDVARSDSREFNFGEEDS